MKIKTLVRVVRAPFLTAVIVPTLVGSAVAWYDGYMHWGYFLLTLLGMICIQAGLDMSNDYFDHKTGTDDINEELTPFSGGSRVIQDGILTARQVLAMSLGFYAVGSAIGVYLAVMRGPTVLWLTLIGIFLAFFHNAPPIKLYNVAPGVGELAVGVGFGPIVVLGAYYVQAQRLTVEALLASIPVGLLIAAVLYINEFPDTVADRAAGKKTASAVMGRQRAAQGYVAIVLASYAIVVLGVVLDVMPPATLLSLAALPLALRAIRGARRFHSDTPKLIPTMATTIQTHLTTGVLLTVGYVIAGVV